MNHIHSVLTSFETAHLMKAVRMSNTKCKGLVDDYQQAQFKQSCIAKESIQLHIKENMKGVDRHQAQKGKLYGTICFDKAISFKEFLLSQQPGASLLQFSSFYTFILSIFSFCTFILNIFFNHSFINNFCKVISHLYTSLL